MRTVIIAASAALVGAGVGWLARGRPPRQVVRYVDRPVAVAASPKAVAQAAPAFPDYPKPLLAPPVETPNVAATPAPLAMTGSLPVLPKALAGGPIGPVTPLPSSLPAADLNADEALARRIVLAYGGEIVSDADATDSTGKVGRALVAETLSAAREKIAAALRRSVGERIVLSDGGAVAVSSPEARKEEDALLAIKKKRDQARIDFLPNAPTLVDLEESYRAQEKVVSDLHRAASHLRLNILIRPGVGP